MGNASVKMQRVQAIKTRLMLAGRKGVRLSELISEFDVGETTMRRDLEEIGASKLRSTKRDIYGNGRWAIVPGLEDIEFAHAVLRYDLPHGREIEMDLEYIRDYHAEMLEQAYERLDEYAVAVIRWQMVRAMTEHLVSTEGILFSEALQKAQEWLHENPPAETDTQRSYYAHWQDRMEKSYEKLIAEISQRKRELEDERV